MLKQIYNQKIFSILLTDYYHLTTSQLYFENNRQGEEAVFYAYIRNNYPNNNYSVFSGIELIVEFIDELKKNPLSQEQKMYLEKIGFKKEFCDFLYDLKFNIKIFSLQEGQVFFPQQPILRVEGTIIECKILEPVILNILNSHCAYATHADRMKFAINFDFGNFSPKGVASVQGLRRGLSLGNSIESSYTLQKHGYNSTSTVLEAYFENQIPAGTMDHCWIMSHKSELEAFEVYAKNYPNNGTFLVDTYNIQNGIENAITVLKKLRAEKQGKKQGNNYGMRIDSEDVVFWSLYILRRLFEEKLIPNDRPKGEIEKLSNHELLRLSVETDLFCCASDSINEEKIFEMRRQGCFVKFWGIGTACSNLPSLGIVYKISKLKEDGIAKLSGKNNQKASLPGRLNSQYTLNEDNKIIGVLIYDEEIGLSNQAIDFYTKEVETYDLYNLSDSILKDVTQQSQYTMLNLAVELENFSNRKTANVLIEQKLYNKFLKVLDTFPNYDLD